MGFREEGSKCRDSCRGPSVLHHNRQLKTLGSALHRNLEPHTLRDIVALGPYIFKDHPCSETLHLGPSCLPNPTPPYTPNSKDSRRGCNLGSKDVSTFIRSTFIRNKSIDNLSLPQATKSRNAKRSPKTLNFLKPQTLDPKPQALNPKSYNLNPKT